MNKKPDESQETVDMPASGVSYRLRDAPTPSFFESGRYEIRCQLGEGGQKRAFLAHDTQLRRDVVISLLKTDTVKAGSIERLRTEAQAMGYLGDHPHVVTIHDIGEEGGEPFIVSEYVAGGSVYELLKNAGEKHLPTDRVLQIADQVCHALAHAHANGIVHRDLKPANVLLTQDGSVKLGDFGLATASESSRISFTGKPLGTVAYMPPEQALGRQSEPRSDLYSLGAMLYEMLTGRPPFLGDQPLAVISQHINTPPVAPSWHNSKIPPDFEKLILQLLAKLPGDRPPSATDVRGTIERISAATLVKESVSEKKEKSLDRLAGGVFVGRDEEMRTLRAALEETISGRTHLLILVGDAGGGKTRTAEELITYGRLRNVQTFIGRCYEGEGAPAFWPWIQIVRSYVQAENPEALMSVMGHGAANIAQMDPTIRERLPELSPPPSLEPKQARFRLFDSVTTFLRNASRSQPLLLFLDDLHWADQASLRLLQFLCTELKDSSLMVIGSYRESELGHRHPLLKTLGNLARQGMLVRVPLHGLSEEDVGKYIQMTAGIDPPGSLVTKVYRETEGNPFFVKEIVRLLVTEGHLEEPQKLKSWRIAIPQEIREVISRRLNQLSKEAKRVLVLASVVGRDFRLEVLEGLSDFSEERLIDLLEEAEAVRVIEESTGTFGSYRFSHALIREALYEEIGSARRNRLHERIGTVLEKLDEASFEGHLSKLAYHFCKAATPGNVDKAINYSIAAAKQADTKLYYEESADHYGRALQILEFGDSEDQARRCQILLALGGAQTKAGDTAAARATFSRAADMARKLGMAEHLARAALGYGASGFLGVVATAGEVDHLLVGLLQEALEALDKNDSSMRSKLLAQLAVTLYYSDTSTESISVEAVDIARRIGDRQAQLTALYSRCFVLSGSEKIEERVAIAAELVRVAEECGNRPMALNGRTWLLHNLLELGDIEAAEAEREIYVHQAGQLRQPLYMWYAHILKAARALREGRFDECEDFLERTLLIAQRAQVPLAFMLIDVLKAGLLYIPGRLEEAELFARRSIEKYSYYQGWRAYLAQILIDRGRQDEARELFEGLANNNFNDLARDASWLYTISKLSWVCAPLQDLGRGNILYQSLSPHEGRNVVVGRSSLFYGPVSYYLGLLSAMRRRWTEAVTHFDRALKMNVKMKAKPFIAYNQYEYASTLLFARSSG